MSDLLNDLEQNYGYDIIIIDTPPINIVPDPLILADENVGLLYVVRQNYSDYREIRKAMAAIDFSKMNLLGMVLYGEKVTTSVYSRSKYYHGRYYGKYYSKYYDAYSKKRESVYGKTGVSQEKWELRTAKTLEFSEINQPASDENTASLEIEEDS